MIKLLKVLVTCGSSKSIPQEFGEGKIGIWRCSNRKLEIHAF